MANNYSNNENRVIEALLKDKDYLYLTSNQLQAVKFRSDARDINSTMTLPFDSNPELAAHSLLNLLAVRAPFDIWADLYNPIIPSISDERVEQIKHALINTLFLVHCIDRLVTHCAANDVTIGDDGTGRNGFSLTDTYLDSWSNMGVTAFYLQDKHLSRDYMVTVRWQFWREVMDSSLADLKTLTVELDITIASTVSSVGTAITHINELMKSLNNFFKGL